MDRLFAEYGKIRQAGYPAEVEAGWLHHRFVCTHPFRDGNGRVARLLMAYCYVRQGLPPPVITAADRDAYITALEQADGGELYPFVEFLAIAGLRALAAAVGAVEKALGGNNRMEHSNGGVTLDGAYYPPGSGEGAGM